MRNASLLLVQCLMFAGAVLIGSCKSADNDGPLLKFNLQKGKTYDYEIVWDMDQKMGENNSHIAMEGTYSIQVIDEKEGMKTLACTYNKFRLYMKMMGLEMDINTDKPSPRESEADMKQNPAGLMANIFKGIKGKSFIVKVNESGDVTDVEGFEKIVSAMVDSIGVEGDVKLQVKASLTDQFNGQAVKDQFVQFFNIFPNRPVKVGDQWEKKYQVSGKMPANFDTRYTVSKIDGNMVTLNSKATITPAAGQVKASGTQTGKLMVDSRTGLVTDAEFEQELTASAQDLTVPVKARGRIKGKEE